MITMIPFPLVFGHVATDEALPIVLVTKVSDLSWAAPGTYPELILLIARRLVMDYDDSKTAGSPSPIIINKWMCSTRLCDLRLGTGWWKHGKLNEKRGRYCTWKRKLYKKGKKKEDDTSNGIYSSEKEETKFPGIVERWNQAAQQQCQAPLKHPHALPMHPLVHV